MVTAQPITIDQQHYAEKFDSRSNLHSSVLEEFLYYLFKDLVRDFGENALIGGASSMCLATCLTSRVI
ncbi:MAG: hypothetical protein V7K98_01340 [Nostoc sp.]|uniref:hypothetical protein n=1 Tax=Nostoc sp. TaxID=1180 RepID=UPI002FF59016